MVTDLQERVRALADDQQAKRERMRREHPGCAEMMDWARRFEPAGVREDGGRMFGRKLPDRRVPPNEYLAVADFVKGLASGAIQPSGKTREKQRRVLD